METISEIDYDAITELNTEFGFEFFSEAEFEQGEQFIEEPETLERDLHDVPSSEQFVVEHRGGTAEDWHLTYSESGEHRFNGTELLDNAGTSLTKKIESGGNSANKVQAHREMLEHFRANPGEWYALPDWVVETPEQITIHVTVARVEAEGFVQYETRSTFIEKVQPEVEDAMNNLDDSEVVSPEPPAESFASPQIILNLDSALKSDTEGFSFFTGSKTEITATAPIEGTVLLDQSRHAAIKGPSFVEVLGGIESLHANEGNGHYEFAVGGVVAESVVKKIENKNTSTKKEPINKAKDYGGDSKKDRKVLDTPKDVSPKSETARIDEGLIDAPEEREQSTSPVEHTQKISDSGKNEYFGERPLEVDSKIDVVNSKAVLEKIPLAPDPAIEEGGGATTNYEIHADTISFINIEVSQKQPERFDQQKSEVQTKTVEPRVAQTPTMTETHTVLITEIRSESEDILHTPDAHEAKKICAIEATDAIPSSGAEKITVGVINIETETSGVITFESPKQTVEPMHDTLKTLEKIVSPVEEIADVSNFTLAAIAITEKTNQSPGEHIQILDEYIETIQPAIVLERSESQVVRPDPKIQNSTEKRTVVPVFDRDPSLPVFESFDSREENRGASILDKGADGVFADESTYQEMHREKSKTPAKKVKVQIQRPQPVKREAQFIRLIEQTQTIDTREKVTPKIERQALKPATLDEKELARNAEKARTRASILRPREVLRKAKKAVPQREYSSRREPLWRSLGFQGVSRNQSERRTDRNGKSKNFAVTDEDTPRQKIAENAKAGIALFGTKKLSMAS